MFVPEESMPPEEVEQRKMDEVTQMLSVASSMMSESPNYNPFTAAEEFENYFPGSNKVPEGGAWVLVKHPPHCEYTVPPLSIWFAEPWPMQQERHCSHRVKIMTPKGELGLFPREYSIVTDPGKYYEFIGEGMEAKFFGQEEGVPKDKLFYIRSRGVSKKDALIMLLGSIMTHGVLWIEAGKEVCAAFGKEWPDESRLATV